MTRMIVLTMSSIKIYCFLGKIGIKIETVELKVAKHLQP